MSNPGWREVIFGTVLAAAGLVAIGFFLSIAEPHLRDPIDSIVTGSVRR